MDLLMDGMLLIGPMHAKKIHVDFTIINAIGNCGLLKCYFEAS